MFKLNPETKQINITRGDTATIEITANMNNELYEFQAGEVVRLKVFERNNCNNVVLVKDVVVADNTTSIQFELSKEDTKIGPVISKYVDYWYEVELNPDTNPQTIIGYEVDEDDTVLVKVFRLLPEGSDE